METFFSLALGLSSNINNVRRNPKYNLQWQWTGLTAKMLSGYTSWTENKTPQKTEKKAKQNKSKKINCKVICYPKLSQNGTVNQIIDQALACNYVE